MIEASIVPSGGGSQYWIVGDHITFKLGPAQTGGRFSFAETTVQPGGGPPPHMHGREDEMFYVLDGSFVFILGDKTWTASRGDAFFLPRGIVHTFKNVGPTPGKLLVGAMPCGFEAFVPEAGCVCMDRSSPPPIDDAAIGKLQAACAKFGLEIRFDFQPSPPSEVVRRDRELWVFGAHVAIKLTSADTNGQFSMVELTCSPGSGVPAHSHAKTDELFYVLEGEFEFAINDKTATAKPGAFIHVPPGVMHSFRNIASVAGKMIDYHTPGDFEKFFEEGGVPCSDRSKPPAAGKPDPAAMVALLARHGMTLAPVFCEGRPRRKIGP